MRYLENIVGDSPQPFGAVAFEGCLHSMARTSQARLVVPPELFDAICCKRAFRVLLQLPTLGSSLCHPRIQLERLPARGSAHAIGRQAEVDQDRLDDQRVSDRRQEAHSADAARAFL